ncbi:hypothetical protein HDU76_003457 [Blyttiomyces sp. JEL0837]|nr:hypothetical protein HDU76_003457 [Blyttiomyces sp. JEL0837]
MTMLSKIYESRSQFRSALDAAVEAVRVFPFSPEIHLQAAKCYRSIGASVSVLKHFENHLKQSARLAEDLRVRVKAAKLKSVMDVDVNEDGEGDFDDEDDWLLDLRCEQEICCEELAKDTLILHLCQEGRFIEAGVLLRERGFLYALSPSVLHYEKPLVKSSFNPWRIDIPFVKSVENALPANALAYMIEAFSPTSRFWTDHNYGPITPYFSYVHDLTPTRSKSRESKDSTISSWTALDEVIHWLHQIACDLCPQAREAKYAEWWAHCRVHGSGHQLHFDSDDEGHSREGGKPRHPIVSSALYLSEEDGIGGPTLVTNQRLGDPLADRGWVVFPKVNRYVMFDGSVLHGVIPGRGTRDESNRRVTFMVAFWDKIKTKTSRDGSPGTARPFPRKTTLSESEGWLDLHRRPKEWMESTWSGNQKLLKRTSNITADMPAVIPCPLENVWISVDDPPFSDKVAQPEKAEDNDEGDESLNEENMEVTYSKSRAGLPGYAHCFQGF